jgi:SAM-dependent methyltransferase
MTIREKGEYVLGTNDEELMRLGFQHRVWGEQAFALWERAGFAPGQTIVDVGCGPGFATLDLARLVGPKGHVIAVDHSSRFLEHLKGQLTAQGIQNVETRLQSVEQLDLPRESVDAAYARWVLCFLGEAQSVVAAVAKALRTGGVFAVQDYFHYRAATLAPRSAIFTRVIEAVDASWRSHGGDSDIAGRVPGMMQQCGLYVREIHPVFRVARPGSALWDWPTTFFRNYIPVLVQMGLLTSADQEEFNSDWSQRTADPATFFCTPPVFDVIGVKT